MKDQTLFAYLNIDHPMVAWEVAIGRLQSVDEITAAKFGISQWAYSMLKNYVDGKMPIRFANELQLEKRRLAAHPGAVSRLHGLYFFKSEDDAKAALDRWGVAGRKKYISAVHFSPTSLTELDSEWITAHLGSDGDSAWMDTYWSGDTAWTNPLTEILATGQGVILNKALRIEAYKRIHNLWPTSTPLLAMACCGFDRCHLNDVAVMKPGLISKGGAIEGSYYIYMTQFEKHQEEIGAAIADCQRTGEFPTITLPADQTMLFTTPDLRPFSFTLIHPDSFAQFASIHNVP